MPPPREQTRAWEPAALWVMGAYSALLIASAWHHDFWGDEAQAWLIARDSPTLGVLLHHVHYEGTPPFWHLLLWGITRFTANPEWMKVPTVLFSLATMALLMRARQLPLWMRVGVVFSYFIAFEYSVIDRNYMPGIALLLGAVACRGSRYEKLGMPVLLALAAMTSLPALIVVVCLGGCYLVEDWRAKQIDGRTWVGVALVAVSVAAGLCIIHPPPDIALELKTLTWQRVVGSSMFLTDAFIPVPQWTMPFWNRPLLGHVLVVRGLVGMALILPLTMFFQRRTVRWFFLAACAVLIPEMIVAARSYERHVGWLFIAFVLALLMERPNVVGEPDELPWRMRLLGALLALQVIAAAVALERSWQYPFTANRQAAQFLLREGLGDVPLVMPEAVGIPMLAYLNRTAYFPGRGSGKSFVQWNTGWRMPENEHVRRSDLEAAAQDGVAPIVVVEDRMSDAQQNALHVKPLEEFDGPTCQGETLFLYR